MESTIVVDDKEITIPRFDSESNQVYNYRINYIKDNNNNTTKISDLIKNSKILANIKFLLKLKNDFNLKPSLK